MKGVVLDWNENASNGLIRGDDGIRYKFDKNSWSSAKTPKVGVNIDFQIKDNLAVDIYAIDIDSLCDTKEKLTEIGKKTAKATKPLLNRLFQVAYIIWIVLVVVDCPWHKGIEVTSYGLVMLFGGVIAIAILRYLILGIFPKDVFKTKNG